MASSEQIRHFHTAPTRTVTDHTTDVSASPICSLCGSAATARAFVGNGRELRVCNRCDLFFVYPYTPNRRQHKLAGSSRHPEIAVLECHRRYRGEVRYYQRHFPRIARECRGATSLLDVGCGTGHLLERFSRNATLECLGLEPDPLTARFARCVAGCQILDTPFEEFRGSRKFDVVTMINVFSHLRSLDAAFRSLRALLAPGGKVILCTNETRRSVFRWNQLHWGMPDGFHFLGRGTLDFLCAKYGFRATRRIRAPYEEELFPGSRWKHLGRGSALYLIK